MLRHPYDTPTFKSNVFRLVSNERGLKRLLLLHKYTAYLKTKVQCVSVTMCSLVMSPFSCDFIKHKWTNQRISNVLTYLPCVQHSNSA